jgi:hypothetical protein
LEFLLNLKQYENFLEEKCPKKIISLLEKQGHTFLDIRGTTQEEISDTEFF